MHEAISSSHSLRESFYNKRILDSLLNELFKDLKIEMLIDFSITNFGPIKDTVKLSFEADDNSKLDNYYVMEPIPGVRLLKLALVYGANASGKTTLIEALDFLRKLVVEPLDKKNNELDYTPFAFDDDVKWAFSSFDLNFICNERVFHYNVQFNKKYIKEETLAELVSGETHVIYVRTTDEENQLSQINIREEYKEVDDIATKLEGATLWNNTVLGASLKTNVQFRLLNDIVEWFTEYLSSMISPSHSLYAYISSNLDDGRIMKEDILQMMKKADLMISDILIKEDGEKDLDDVELLEKLRQRRERETHREVKEIRVKVSRRHLEFVHTTEKGSGVLRYYQESLGTQRFYQFSGLVDLLVRNSVFFSIDEVEASLHPDLFEFFLYSFLCNAKHSQLLATTHYREFLMNGDMVRPDAIWFTDKKADGSTVLYSLMDFDETIFTSNRSFYDAYKIGRLGAKPNIGDYYMDFYHEGKK